MDTEEGVPIRRCAAKGGRVWRRALERRLPIVGWARGYGRLAAAADAVAGVTLGLTLVPQAIAYAALADLPVHVGLYTSFLGTILYTFLGTVKEVSIGPTSLMALLTLQACRGLGLPYVVLLTFLAGCVVLLMGLLRLGFMVDLISSSVTSGFTSATAVIIVASQLKGVLGLSFSADSVGDNLRMLAARAHLARASDAGLAAVCCTVLLLLRKLKDVPVKSERIRKALWLVSIGRNALVVLAAAAFAYGTARPGEPPYVLLSGRVEGGLPSFALPPFSVTEGNTTVPLSGMLQRLGPSVLLLPIVMVIANIAIAKAFTTGGRVDASQEMVALGLSNVCGAFVGAMPACGAFTRSAVAHSSGVRSPAASLLAGIITLLALAFLTEYFYFIPKACLSSVLICAVVFMIDYQIVARLWRRDRWELTVVGATFIASVAATVELGVLAGCGCALLLLLLRMRRPNDRLALLKTAVGEAVVWRPARALVFFNAERSAAAARAAVTNQAPRAPLLLDATKLTLLDYAASQVIERLSSELSSSGSSLVPYNASGEVLQTLTTLQVEQRALRATSAASAIALLQPTTPVTLTPNGDEEAPLLTPMPAVEDAADKIDAQNPV